MQKTYFPKQGDITSKWYLIDAADKNLGRLSTKIARILLGKNKPEYTPGADTGDYVIVINAEKISVTGNRLDQKFYYRHSGYPGGIKKISLRDQLAKFPERVITHSVHGMLPKNRYGRMLLGKLKVYAGPEHPHKAQQPELLN
ncbi:MAG: 50S ribosomal protein L13 [Anaerolineales bacterium]|nr:50S ribosomal protein L13 [Anaerolineales bacterium]